MAKEKEKKAFDELKKRMEGQMERELYEDDNVFYRFLRARDLNVNMAEAMLRKHLEWRKTFDVKNISKFESPEVLKEYLPVNFLGFTKEGYVLRYVPSGNFDCRGLFASCPMEYFHKHLIKFYEEDLERLKEQSEKMGKLVDKVVYIHDMKELTLAKATDRKVLFRLIGLGNIYQDNYPETLKTIYVINAPTFVGFIYNVLKSFLPNQIVNKIKIFTDDSWEKELLEIADAEIIPAFLGGRRTDPDGNPLCNTFIGHAGSVPEKYYIRNKQSFVSLPDVQKISVSRAGVYEMCQEIKEPGSYLEWEFLVKSGDIKFGIMYRNDNEEKSEVVALERVTTDDFSETGVYKCENAGTYFVVFDNSYSLLRSKDIYYKFQVISPQDVVQ